MRKTPSLISSLLLLGLVTAAANAHLPGGAPVQDTPRFAPPREIVARYMAAVDRGELTVFGRTLDRSMIEPASVEYVFDLETGVSRIRIFSKIQTPIYLPGIEGCKLYGISAVISFDGRILETEVHLHPMETDGK